jgi:dynein heavy chain
LKKSVAAVGICDWVVNIVKYYDIYCEVQPKRERLAEAQERFVIAQKSLEEFQAKFTTLNA